jgi:hypothetical protein
MKMSTAITIAHPNTAPRAMTTIVTRTRSALATFALKTRAISFATVAKVALAIAALIMAAKHCDDPCIAADPYMISALTWKTFLIVYGVVTLSLFVYTAIVGPMIFWILGKDSSLAKVGAGFLASVTVLGYFFLFAWFFVGAFLYFRDVEPYCVLGQSPIGAFGISWFIIEICTWCIVVFGPIPKSSISAASPATSGP